MNYELKHRPPKLIDFSLMRGILEPHLAEEGKHFYINDELGIVYGSPRVFRLVLQQTPPFVIDDHRLGVVTRGEIEVSVNLVEKRLTAGTLVFLGPGTIISPVRFSADLEIFGIGLSSRFPMPFALGQLPHAFNGQVRDFQIPVSEGDVATARHIVDTLWHAVHRQRIDGQSPGAQPDYHRPTVSLLVGALMHHYDALYRQHADRLQSTQSREQTIFDRFIALVNQHCDRHHHIGYYAGRMCITERYLGTVVRQASGTTAKEWIDRALTTRAKVLLRHTGQSVAEISEELRFPNPSFFSKYFRRMTGLTPLEFRRQ